MNNFVFDQRDNANKMDFYAIANKPTIEVLLVGSSNNSITVPIGTLIGKLTGFSTRIQGTLYDQVLLDSPAKFGAAYGAVKTIDCIHQKDKPIAPKSKNLAFIPIGVALLGMFLFFRKK